MAEVTVVVARLADGTECVETFDVSQLISKYISPKGATE